jgi:hypothetical protein
VVIKLSGLWVGFVLLGAAVLSGEASVPPVGAIFNDDTSTSNNDLATDLLDPALNLVATGGVTIRLDWTATPDTYAAGYRVYRKDGGGPFTQIATITPRTTTTLTNSTGLNLTLTYQYYVVAYYENWTSTQTNTVTCIGAITVFVC